MTADVGAYILEFTRADVERLSSIVETARVVQVAYFPATGTWSLRLVDGYTTDRRCEYCAREVARRQGYEKMLVERDNRIKELERQLKEGRMSRLNETVTVVVNSAEDAKERLGGPSGLFEQASEWSSKTPDEIIADVTNLVERLRRPHPAQELIPVAIPLRTLKYHGRTREQRKKHHEMIAGYLSISIKEAKDLCTRATAPQQAGRFAAYFRLPDEYLRRRL